MNTTTIRKKKKEALEPSEFKAFSKWVDGQLTKTDAAEKIGVTYLTLTNVMLKRTGSPETIAKIRAAISKQ